MSRIIPVPPAGETITRSSVKLPDSLWTKLEKISKETLDAKGERLYTRDQIIEHLLRWALNEYDAEKKAKK